MRIKEEVDSVQVVGEVSNRTMKSINMIGIWSDREGMLVKSQKSQITKLTMNYEL